MQPEIPFKGAVKGYNLNNISNEERLLTSIEEILVPDKFYFKNGIVKLAVTNSGVDYYYWNYNSNNYVLINSFDLGDVNLIKPLVINSNVIQIQIEDTKWTLRRGKPFVYVEHPYRDIKYNPKTIYNYDQNSANAESLSTINMLYFPNCNIYNDEDVIRLMIIKTERSKDIKTDCIPQDELTGIGHYDVNASSDYNTSDSIAKEFFKPVDQYIKLVRI
jgi:hypothetical protein